MGMNLNLCNPISNKTVQNMLTFQKILGLIIMLYIRISNFNHLNELSIVFNDLL